MTQRLVMPGNWVHLRWHTDQRFGRLPAQTHNAMWSGYRGDRTKQNGVEGAGDRRRLGIMTPRFL